MLRTVIIGCGKIADQHIQAIRRIPGSEVVGLCDQEVLMARQLGERFGIDGCYSDVGKMLDAARPDVVHITTPPQSHYALGKQCLASGCHVYLEKPFTVTAAEAEALIAAAKASQRLVTAGHNYQFTPEMLQMRRIVAAGGVGEKGPLHLESHWGYDLGDVSYVGPLLGNAAHWVRRLPGQLFHNLISHGVARLAEFLDDELVLVQASAHQSEQLRGYGVGGVLDELRVMLRDGKGTTGFFCFSTQIKPGLNWFRVCGSAGSVVVDLGSGTLTTDVAKSYKSYLTFVVPPFKTGIAHLRNARRNLLAIARRQLYQDAGMKELIHCFHLAVSTGAPPPIPYREILLTARIMDAVFTQIRATDAHISARLSVGECVT
jgi:predicted dehydrogenase